MLDARVQPLNVITDGSQPSQQFDSGLRPSPLSVPFNIGGNTDTYHNHQDLRTSHQQLPNIGTTGDVLKPTDADVHTADTSPNFVSQSTISGSKRIRTRLLTGRYVTHDVLLAPRKSKLVGNRTALRGGPFRYKVHPDRFSMSKKDVQRLIIQRLNKAYWNASPWYIGSNPLILLLFRSAILVAVVLAGALLAVSVGRWDFPSTQKSVTAFVIALLAFFAAWGFLFFSCIAKNYAFSLPWAAIDTDCQNINREFREQEVRMEVHFLRLNVDTGKPIPAIQLPLPSSRDALSVTLFLRIVEFGTTDTDSGMLDTSADADQPHTVHVVPASVQHYTKGQYLLPNDPNKLLAHHSGRSTPSAFAPTNTTGGGAVTPVVGGELSSYTPSPPSGFDDGNHYVVPVPPRTPVNPSAPRFSFNVEPNYAELEGSLTETDGGDR